MTVWRQAPPDATADAAFERIAQLARENCLVVEGYGGALVIATPAAQREQGVRAKVLATHLATEPAE